MPLESVREAFLGGDPIAGKAALDEFIAQGDAGEAFLFSSPIKTPTVQVRRRWLQYVATRPGSVGPRLEARVRDGRPHQDGVQAADLFVGLPPDDPALARMDAAFEADFARGTPSIGPADDYWRVASTMTAVGAGHRTPWSLWHATHRDSYAWEKLSIHAFRAACCVAARFGKEHLGLLERFVTRGGQPAQRDDIDASELWLQAYRTFTLWRPGPLLDEIFARWSTHKDPRVRRFGAMILNAVAFRRAQPSLSRWIAVESDAAICDVLVTALARCGTPASADAVLDLAARGAANREALAVGARFATDRAAAVDHLEHLAGGSDAWSAEALVSLARMGVASQSLSAALFDQDNYRRLNAALAYGVLRDRSRIDDLMAMRTESSGPMETVYLTAALAMLGPECPADELHNELAHFASGWSDGGELFYLKPALQQAIITAFDRGGEAAAPFLEAWRAQFEPLAAVIKPVEAAGNGRPVSKAAALVTASAAEPAPVSTHRSVPARFRVAFSFAGAQRAQVTAVADALEQRVGRGLVFLDDWFQAYVAGNDADLLLQRIYGQQSDLVVMCIAAAYDDRPWTLVEHRALRALTWGAKAGSTQAMRVLPLRFGEGDVEGVLSNTIAPDVRRCEPADVVELILARLQLIGV